MVHETLFLTNPMSYADFTLEMFDRMFGIAVVTGENWKFLRLDGATLTLDRRRRYIDLVEAILGILVAIVGT